MSEYILNTTILKYAFFIDILTTLLYFYVGTITYLCTISARVRCPRILAVFFAERLG